MGKYIYLGCFKKIIEEEILFNFLHYKYLKSKAITFFFPVPHLSC